MLLTEETKEILNNFRTINNSMVFAKGNVIRVVHKNKHAFAEATISETFPKEFGIFDVKKLLDVLNTNSNCDLDFEDTQIKITQRDKLGNSLCSTEYIYSNTSHIIHNNTATAKIDDLITCQLSESNISEIFRHASILMLEDLVISGDDNSIKIKLFDKSVKGLHNSFELNLGDNASGYIFDAYFKIDNLKLMRGSYTIKLGKALTEFTLDNTSVKYWVSNERDTVFQDK